MNSQQSGYIFAISAFVVFASQDAISKHLAESYHPVMITFIRFWPFAVFAVFLAARAPGGIKGALGVAEDKAEASIACRQVGPISFPKPLPRQEEVFNERISLVFKKLRIVRMVDAKRNALVYLTYSDRVIEGSPKNAVTAVAVDPGTPIPLR